MHASHRNSVRFHAPISLPHRPPSPRSLRRPVSSPLHRSPSSSTTVPCPLSMVVADSMCAAQPSYAPTATSHNSPQSSATQSRACRSPASTHIERFDGYCAVRNGGAISWARTSARLELQQRGFPRDFERTRICGGGGMDLDPCVTGGPDYGHGHRRSRREGSGRQLEQAERRCMFRSGIEPHWHISRQTGGRGRTVRAKRRALYSYCYCYSWKFVSSSLRVMCEEFSDSIFRLFSFFLFLFLMVGDRKSVV